MSRGRFAVLRRIVVWEVRTREIEVAHEEYQVEDLDIEPGEASADRPT